MNYDHNDGEKTGTKEQRGASAEQASRTKFFVKFENNVKIPSLSTKSSPASTKRPLTNLSNKFSRINDISKPIETNILNWQLEDNTAKAQKIYKSLAELYEVPFQYTLEENNNFYASGHNPQYASVNPYLKGIIEYLSSLNEHDINSPIGLQWEKKLKMLNVICSNMPYKSNISDSFRMCPKLNKDVLFSVFNMMKLEESKSKNSQLTTIATTSAATSLNENLNIFDKNMTNNAYENELVSLIMTDREMFNNESKIGPPSNPPSDLGTKHLPKIDLQRIFETHKKQEEKELVSELASLIINILLKICFLSFSSKKTAKLESQRHNKNDPDHIFFKYIFYMTPEYCPVDDFTMHSSEQLKDTQMFLDLQGFLFNRLKAGSIHITDLTNYYKVIKNQFIQFLKESETKPSDQQMNLVDFKLTMFDHIFSTTLDLAYNNQCQFPIIKDVLKPTLKVIESSSVATGSPAIDPRTAKQQDLSYTDSYEFELLEEWSFHFKQNESYQDSSKKQIDKDSLTPTNKDNLEPSDMDISAESDKSTIMPKESVYNKSKPGDLAKEGFANNLTELDYADFNENCIDILSTCSFKPLSVPLDLTQTIGEPQPTTSKLSSSDSDQQLNKYLDTLYNPSLMPSTDKNCEETASSKTRKTIFDRLGKNSNEDESVSFSKKYVHPDDEDWEQDDSLRGQSMTVFERLGRKSERDISNISPSPKRSRSCNRYSPEYRD